MATFTGTAIPNATTLVQTQSWASFPGKAMIALGWKQTNDTGQVVWGATVMNISQVASGGGNSVYTYDATAMLGPLPQVGNAVVIGGFVTGGNNVAVPGAIITALGGSGAASTFTVVTTTQTNETHAAGGVIGSQFTVSQVAVSGGNSVYTYNAAAVTGPALRVGMAMWVTGFVTGGNNVSNRNIIALGGSGASSTFTLATTTQVNETHAASAFNGPNVQFSSAGGNTFPSNTTGLYEIFVSQDALSSTCPITVRFDYAQSSVQPALYANVGLAGTNGAGVLNTPNTGLGGVHNVSSQSSDNVFHPCVASGDGGNFRMLICPGGASNGVWIFFCVGRAYDGTGAQITPYVLLWMASNSKKTCQAIFLTGALGPLESSVWIAAVGGVNQSAGFGGNVAVSPAYVNVGGFNNPSPDLVVGKTNDFLDGTQVTVAFYNVNHNYYVSNSGATLITSIACALLMRFE